MASQVCSVLVFVINRIEARGLVIRLIGGDEHIHFGSFRSPPVVIPMSGIVRTHLFDCIDVVAQLFSRVKKTSCDSMDLSCQHNTYHMLYLDAAGSVILRYVPACSSSAGGLYNLPASRVEDGTSSRG